MKKTNSTPLSFRLVVISIVWTLSLWGWILTRPPGTFNDQGGMLISFFYFPGAFLGWLCCGVPGLVMAIRSRRRMDGSEKMFAGASIGLGILGFLLAVATLLIA